MKTMGIEAFLSWVYRSELPKAEASGTGAAFSLQAFGEVAAGWDAVSRQGELMAEMVSDGRLNGYGVIPLPSWYGEPPHPDAFAAHRAAGELAGVELDLPPDWNPLSGLGLTDEEAQDAIARALPRIAFMRDHVWRLRLKPAELVRRFAILGGAPNWQAESPKRRLVEMRGKPAWFRLINIRSEVTGRIHAVEVDGRNPKTHRPYPDAYRKTTLAPDPALVAVERAEYEVWHAALVLLTDMLNETGVLAAHRLRPPSSPARPWENAGTMQKTA